MRITDPTRNALYAKSGNRCAYPGCNKELITDDTNNSNICHIISRKPNGPRHDPKYIDYDNEENLILLCRNHHNEVDKNVEKYSVDILHDMKKIHEQLIREVLENNSEFNNLKGKLLKGIDEYDIIAIIGNEDYSSAFPADKLINILNFARDIDSKILTEYNIKFVNSKFISSMKTLSSNLHALSGYLRSNTEISANGSVVKVMKDKALDSEHINSLRVAIANELKKYIQ